MPKKIYIERKKIIELVNDSLVDLAYSNDKEEFIKDIMQLPTIKFLDFEAAEKRRSKCR